LNLLGKKAWGDALVCGFDTLAYLWVPAVEQAGRNWHKVCFSLRASGAVKGALWCLWLAIPARYQRVICTQMQDFLKPGSTKADHQPGSTVCEFLKLRFFLHGQGVIFIFSQINQCVDSFS
jgi:hypothetical protein